MDTVIKPKAQAGTKSKVGLDIGTYSVKILQITENPIKPILSGIGLKKIAGYSEERVSDLIKTVAEEAGVSAKEVNISVSGHPVIMRFISMPKMKEEDLKNAIKFEAEKFIPFEIKDCMLAFQVLAKNEKESKSSILLVAAKKEYVQQKIKIVERAGFSVSVMDVDSFAMTNSFLKNFPNIEPDKTAALLNIGATFTNLSILRGGMIYFARDAAIGGNDFNDAISKGLGLSLDLAEELKLSPKERASEVKACIKAALINLMDDIKLSFSYYENQSGRSIDDIYISGASSSISGIDEIFQENVGSKPLIWNPLQFMDTSSPNIESSLVNAMSNSFSVASGLVLR